MFIIDELAMYNCPKGMNKVVLYCIVLYCIVLYCIVKPLAGSRMLHSDRGQGPHKVNYCERSCFCGDSCVKTGTATTQTFAGHGRKHASSSTGQGDMRASMSPVSLT